MANEFIVKNGLICNGTVEASVVDLSCTDGVYLGGNQFAWAPGGCANDNTSVGIGAGNPSAGLRNTFIGADAGLNVSSTGDDNTVMGAKAGYQLGSGSDDNVLIGSQAGYSMASNSDKNIVVGVDAGYGITTGDENIVIGYQAGYALGNGGSSVLIGMQAGLASTGAQNVLVGGYAGSNSTSSNFNVLIGYQAGQTLTTGDSNVFLGYNAGKNATGSNLLYIENTNSATPLIYGEFDNNIVTVNGAFNATGTISGSSNVIVGGNVGIGSTAPVEKVDINQGNIHVDNVPSATATVTGGTVTTMTVGESVVFGDVLYMKSDGKLWKTDADAVATMPVLSMAIATISADAAGKVTMNGFVRDDSYDLTVGGVVYASTTAGSITQTAPTGTGDQVQSIGVATHADRFYFSPDYTMIEIA